MPYPVPPVKKKSELEKQIPIRKCDSDNDIISSPSCSMKSVRVPSLSNSKTKKMKNLVQVILKSKKAKLDLEEVGLKKRKMDGRTFKSLFKRQRVKEVLPDVAGPDNTSHSCHGDISLINPETVGRGDVGSDGPHKRLVGKITGFGYDKVSDGDLQKSISNSKGTIADTLRNKISIDSNHIDNAVNELSEPPNGDGLEDSRINLNTSAAMDESEKLSTSSSPAKNMDAPKPGISDGMARARHGALSSESGEKFIQAKVACTTPSRSAMFLEYWVPVQISNYQLELYCDTLVCNSSALCSYSRTDSVGALSQALRTVQKCCAHPYLVDSSVQEALFAEQRPSAEILDVGINSSGKLHLLDLMLAKIKNQGMRVLILFQMIADQGGPSIGDILDGFLRQRFVENSFERVDASVSLSKKQAAVNRFNKKDHSQFVFLLENRACSSAVTLSSLDLIIIYNSDWNPVNDLKAIQKISIDSKDEKINVFRLYSSFTVEERALVLAKQNQNLDNNLQNQIRSTFNTLLMWGAQYLFSKLDEYRTENNSTAFKISSCQFLLNEVIKEFQFVLSKNCKSMDCNPLISKGRLDAGIYVMDTPMLGEAKIQLKDDGIEPHIFWKNVLRGRKQQGKFLRGSCPRNRKRIECVEGLPWKSCNENDYVNKKCKSVVNGNVEPVSVQDELREPKVSRSAGSEADHSAIISTSQSQSLQIDGGSTNDSKFFMLGQSSVGAVVGSGELDERVSSMHEDNLPDFLPGEMTRLCQILKLSENVECTVKRFLEYVIKNHDINSDSPTIMQAFQISACWIATLISKQKVDKKYSFHLAKTHLNYQCTEEQVSSVYSKMRTLKRMYLQSLENTFGHSKYCLLADEDINEESADGNDDEPQFSSFKLKNVKTEIEENFITKECLEVQIPLQLKLGLEINGSENEIEDNVKKLHKKCEKKMKKLLRKQKTELQELQKTWDMERVKLEGDHKLESVVIRSIRGVKDFRLKLLDDYFAKKMEEHNLLKELQLKDIKAKHLAAWKEESQKASDCLAEAIACSSKLGTVDVPQSFGFRPEDDAGCSKLNSDITPIIPEFAVSMPQLQPIDHNPSKSVYGQGNDVAPSDTSVVAAAESVSCTDLAETVETLGTVDSSNEVGVMSIERSPSIPVEHINQLIRSNMEEVDSVNLVLGGQISDEIQSVEMNMEAPVELLRPVSNEVVDPVALSTSFNTEDPVATLNSEVNHRDEPDESINVNVPSPGQPSVHSEQMQSFPGHHESINVSVPPGQEPAHSGQMQAFPDQFDLSTEHVSQDEIHLRMDFAEPQNQDEDAQAMEIQSTLHTEVSILEPVDTATIVESNNEAPLIGNCEQLRQVSGDLSLSCSHSPPSVIVHQTQCQGKSSSLPMETQSTLHTEVSTLEPVDTATIVESNNEAPIIGNFEQLRQVSVDVSLSCSHSPLSVIVHQTQCQGESPSLPTEIQTTLHTEVSTLESYDAATIVESNNEASIIGNGEQLRQVSVDVSLSCSHSPPSVIVHQTQCQGKSPLQPTEAGETEEISLESVSPSGENLQCHNHLDLEMESRIANEQRVALSPDNTITIEPGRTAELPNQATAQSNTNAGHAHGSIDLLVHPTHQFTSTSAVLAEPLQNELEKLGKEAEELEKMHRDLRSQLKSNYEKERHEILNQLRIKYEGKLQDAEVEFRLKKNEIDKNQNKVLLNKKLAEAFRSKCSVFKSSGCSVLHQAFPSSYLQYPQQPPSVRTIPGASACQPFSSQQNTSPPTQAMHQLYIPTSVRSSTISSQNGIAPPAVQSVHSESVFSGTLSRPPVISCITPSANPRVGGEIRSRPPHLQPFRPAAPSSIMPTSLNTISQQPILPPPYPLLMSQLPPPSSLPPSSLPMPPNFVFQNIPASQIVPQNTLDRIISVMELPQVTDHLGPMNHHISRIPDTGLSASSIQPSDFVVTSSNVQGDQVPSTLGLDVVCLSDDDE